MTRKIEIFLAARDAAANEERLDTWDAHVYEDGFYEGAKWADKTTLNKARMYLESKGLDANFINEFCKAMRE